MGGGMPVLPIVHAVHFFTLPCIFISLAGLPFFLRTTSIWIANRWPKGSFHRAATLVAVAVDIGGSPGSRSPAPSGADDEGLAPLASGTVWALAADDEGRARGPVVGTAPSKFARRAVPEGGGGGGGTFRAHGEYSRRKHTCKSA